MRIYEETGFYSKINLFRIPKVSWTKPETYEEKFMEKCIAAANPETNYRMLVVSES